jgi:hypothetical protein
MTVLSLYNRPTKMASIFDHASVYSPPSTLHQATVNLAGNKWICSGSEKIILENEHFYSFAEYLKAHPIQEQWCYCSIRNLHQCHLLIQGIWQGSLAIVSDGSYMLDYTTAGIIIVGTENARMENCIFAPGRKQDMSSYRGN